ncbi:Wadjet anti-phage system protein JetD domain-containing protein [Jingyaoa shaoxingensis]|uniref:Wadjet protein JetD C-terminal domain-containing protein n=1 Tax=Jingyaoa shaoxingensis TaxID=2763671 RepID=A0ABR7N6H2_9FIRM|nr:Wadjet anti-phage system protein JetD domain-containing protein [Jingyaoa shaoxingensis]MBC8572000.1 hypothetical protein [Jingyaoa shaoxingensis]
MKRISLDTLLRARQDLTYQEQYRYICSLLEAGQVKPVKTSRMNGKKPALYREYWIVEKKKDYGNYMEEIKYNFCPEMSVDYYLAHPEVYEKDRPYVLRLNEYLKEDRNQTEIPESWNERSFEIWNREKFLNREHGRTILKRCGIRIEVLNVYETAEPMAYYTNTRETPQNLLILENKDPFFSMRNYLMQGHIEILGTEIGTLIYGAGKRILRSFQDFDLCAEPYMIHSENTIYYFGDLDYEGIGIYENLAEKFQQRWKIRPFLPAYLAMLKKADSVHELPDTKELQNRNIGTEFFSYFDENTVRKMKDILESGRYIPQEILNTADFIPAKTYKM